MAMLISRRLFRSFASLNALSYSDNAATVSSLFSLSNALKNTLSSAESSVYAKHEFSFLALRRLSTSILTPESGEGEIPSDLLSRKRILTPDREIDIYISFIDKSTEDSINSLYKIRIRAIGCPVLYYKLVGAIGLYQDLVIPVSNFNNEDKGLMVLPGDVFDVPIRKDIVHRVVRWQLAKRQQGTHSTKTISEVSGTGRKPWPQKGTGRARHGTLRGPQFRGGAIMHGPKPRSHAIKLNKKVRRLGLKIALSAYAAEGKLMVFDDFEIPSHKTKNIVNWAKQMENSKKFLLVDGGPIDEKLKLATQNIHYVNVLPTIGLNVYSIMLHDTLVMSRSAVDNIVTRMNTPINR